jgi:hypothetical protein
MTIVIDVELGRDDYNSIFHNCDSRELKLNAIIDPRTRLNW